ncbi:hypothetical protein ACVIU7_009686 [Bradyrhizobium liaoningense]
MTAGRSSPAGAPRRRDVPSRGPSRPRRSARIRRAAGPPLDLAVEALDRVGNRYEMARCQRSAAVFLHRGVRCDHRDRGTGSTKCGQADAHDEPRARVSSWPPLRLARLRRERESVVVVSPAAPVMCSAEEVRMRRIIGIDVHRTFGEVVFWENGRLRHAGRIDMTRTALEVRIPIYSGRVFRLEAGHRSDLKPATIPK